ncbi:MAG TPA: hypothetical protein VGL27_13820 [Negativicutes bacterium]
MSVMIAEKLKSGVIFGDHADQEYVYLPAGEIGMEIPLCVIETPTSRQDISVDNAVKLILRLSLKPVRHPMFGAKSC